MMFDLKIILLGTTPELLGLTAFGILGLIWPLSWPGTFIPLLPKKLETVLEMPFGSIIGVHSTLCPKLANDNFGAYFVLNADTHDGSSVVVDDFPDEIIEQMDIVAEEIKELIRVFKPLFPGTEIQKKIKEFICRALGRVYNTDWKSPWPLYDVFRVKRQSIDEDIAGVISQTQFVDTMFREALEDENYEIIEALWPNHDLSESHGIDTLRIAPVLTAPRFGLIGVATSTKRRVTLAVSTFEAPPEEGSPIVPDSLVSDADWEHMINLE
jgi:hypothetical protein